MCGEKKSRVTKGAAENNRNELRDVIETAYSYDVEGPGIYIIKDKAENIIYVDTNLGKTASLNYSPTGLKSLRWYEDGTTSKKTNGYVYTPIMIRGINNEIKLFMCGTHTLVGMLAHRDEYDLIDASGKTPIINHEDNCSWNNAADNLGWCTQGFNRIHERVLYSIHSYYPGVYTEIKNNLSSVDFVVYTKSIGIKTIKKYLEFVGDKDRFKTKNKALISKHIIDNLITWVDSNNMWNR